MPEETSTDHAPLEDTPVGPAPAEKTPAVQASAEKAQGQDPVKQTPAEQPLEEMVFAVMGATGVGKTTFINLLSWSNLPVGSGLRSCTSRVETSNTFELNGRPVTLIDTPGFDDTTVSDTDILKMISIYLSSTYQGGRKLNGIIYMHRISDVRMTGVSRRNFNMFRQLCGDETLKNVMLVTNMWCDVALERGAAREHQLRTDPLLFKPVLDGGATMVRHDGSITSAQGILAHMFDNSPRALRIQREIVDEDKDITDTAAGRELERDLTALREQYNRQLAEVRQEMTEALAAKDVQMKKELEEVRADLQARITRIEDDRARLAREFAQEKARANAKVKEVQDALDKEIRAREQKEKEVVRLPQELHPGVQAVAKRERRDTQVREMLQQQKPLGLFGFIGRAIQALFS